MSRRVPRHGTVARRKGTKLRPPCECVVCIEGSRRAWKADRVRRSRGGAPPVAAEPVRQHVNMLVEAGRTVTSIVQETGLSESTICGIRTGRLDQILQGTASKLLAVQPFKDARSLVDSTGSVRRLRALVVMGHSQETLALEIGCGYTRISDLTHGRFPQITAALEQQIRAVYEKLSMMPGPSLHGRSRAKRNGWYGPLAWDDDMIDDPAAVPQTDAVMPVATEGGNLAARWLLGESVILDDEARKEVLAHLYEWTNYTTQEIADRLDMTPAAAEQRWNRLKRQAQLEGRTLRRRVYVARRSMNQDEMGAAA